MDKIISYIALALIVLVGGFFMLNSYIYNEKQADTAADYKNATYVIEGTSVTLKDGVHEAEAASGSASKVVTRYFGNEVTLDLNADNRDDVVFLLTQETGGGGVFYYAVAALNTENGYVGSQALLLGDRIAPQTTEISQDPSHVSVVVINYADRAPGEPMTTQPSVGKSIWLKLDVDSMQFGEVVQNFEGEADPARMTLDMKTWVWQKALYNNDTEVVPRVAGKFTLTFKKDGSFAATTDCNSAGGSYTATGNTISFGNIASTLMYCEESQEGVFLKLLQDSTNFLFTSKGELVLGLKFDSGSVMFK